MKKIIFIIVILLLLGAGAYFIFKKPKVEDTNNTDTTIEEEQDTETKEEEKEELIIQDEEDFTGFSDDDQVIGVATEDLFNIESITDESKTGYHRFSFNLSTTGTDDPYVTAKYNSSTGVIRVELNSIDSDKSGIGYQKDRAINKEGIIRLYHAVTSTADKEIYDIGLAKSTIFKLYKQSGDGQLKVILDVKYPGEVTSTIDLGSTEFSTELQDISGIANATIKSYSYSSSGGILKFVWSVTAEGENPIPSVTGEYLDDNTLSIKFTSLTLDRVVNAASSLTLPTGITIDSSKEGSASIYNFIVGSKKEYKLSATTSPNQVILEIDL
ncbi:MAG TPA: hypothetical protein PKW94_00615 [Candidatus Dojkabacteria bacterium]|nr:hypothetical protein [Candidatus Dojkabacteria bacterium]